VASAKADESRRPALTVAWVGPRPAWLELDSAVGALDDVVFSGAAIGATPDLVVVAGAALEKLVGLRKSSPEGVIVLDLTGDGDPELRPPELSRARTADALFAGSQWELNEICRRLPSPLPRTAVVPRPVDLDWFAPEPVLADTKLRGRDLRRFRRFHRLAGATILFAGPYTREGGLDLLIEAVIRLRERVPELRLAAIPHGPTDPRYRDRCEMRMLGLGHRGIVEWEPVEHEIPFWYATASLVCAPAREAGSPEPAKRAAAAARPFVGSNLEPFLELGVGRLVPAGDLEALEAALEELLVSEEEATNLGLAARRRVETEYSPTAAAQALRREWERLLGDA
jgi:glycosyltransferase involved in cell wall biosynthesis